MDIDTRVPEGQNGQVFRSPDLRLRDSSTLWGPLQLTICSHREGVERGYVAGEHAYHEHMQRQGHHTDAFEGLETSMNVYLTLPMYRPRHRTTKILEEWKAMFLLGWTGQALAHQSLTSGEQEGGTTR